MEENEVENTWKNCALKIFISCQKLQRYMIMSWYAKGPSVTIFRQGYIFLCLKEFICSANLQENNLRFLQLQKSNILWHKVDISNCGTSHGLTDILNQVAISSYCSIMISYDKKMFIFMAKTKSNWKIIHLSTQNTVSTSYSWFLLLLHISHTI